MLPTKTINWRNHLKERHPELSLISGTDNFVFDEKSLANYDFVFLNTSNMAHKTYYRIIDVLRERNVPFDYLGRYSNQNLIEQEMAEILMRRYAENRE